MKPIKQEHSYGCGVACVAYITKSTYHDVVNVIKDGRNKVKNKGFFCKDLVSFLNDNGLHYYWNYVNSRIRNKIYQPGTIVFVKRSNRYPSGHYLVRCDNKWMDPWINFPDLNIKSGFTKKLPGKPIYAILSE